MMSAVRFAGPLLVVALATAAHADVAELSPSKDNTLYEDALGRDLSNGAGQHMFVGSTALPPPNGNIRRAVIRFDIAAAIPGGSTINSVSLVMSMSKTISGPQTVELHRLLRDWGEGASVAPGQQGGGAQAAGGDATWRHTFFPEEFWQNPGGDFDATVSGQTSIVGNGVYTWNSTPRMVEDVQRWIDQPSDNFGWLIRGPENVPTTAKRFDTREHPTPGNRPSLTIDFTLPITDCNGNGIDDAIDIASGFSEDCNNNGVPDECDDDRDGDGVIDDCDGCPDDPNKSDAGVCGCGNVDDDSDGDGVPDCLDDCPNDPNKSDPGVCGCGNADDDSDGDGVPDCLDDCPNDPNKSDPGVCGCGNADDDSDGDGVLDCDDVCPGQDDFLDSDGDGVVDCLDGCPLDPDKTQPGLLGCGVAEVDSDGDGVPDSVDKCPGQDDNADADGDRTPDCLDDCPNDPDKTEPGDCGCGELDSDADGDGVPDCIDNCPNDPDKTEPGDCGCGELDSDADGDQIPDCIDNCPETFNPEQTDSDEDGAGDVCDPPDEPDDDAMPDDGDADMQDDDSMRVEPDMMPECGGDACGWGVMPMMPAMLVSMSWARIRRGRGRQR